MIRLFIDPASKQTGWALFKNNKVIKSGTVAVKGDLSCRLNQLYWQYAHKFSIRTKVELKECHIEQFGGTINNTVVQAVGAIRAGVWNICPNVEQDIPVRTWQKYVGWPNTRGIGSSLRKDMETNWMDYLDKSTTHEVLYEYGKKVKSLDELAAIGMGLWYTEEGYKAR